MKRAMLCVAVLCLAIMGAAHGSEKKGVVLVPLNPAHNLETGESFNSWSLDLTGLPQAMRGDLWSFDFLSHYTVDPSGWPIGNTWIERIASPTWVSVDGGMGVYGVASGGAGQYDLTLRGVSEVYGPTEEQVYSVTVNDWQLNTANLPDAARGEPYSFSFESLKEVFPGSYDLGALQWTATGLPSGLEMNASGTVSGTPTEASIDYAEGYTFPIDVTAARASGQQRSQSYALYVEQSLDDWSLDAANLPDGVRNSEYSGFSFAGRYTVTPSSFDIGDVTWAASGLPDGMSISSGGALSGTPAVSGDFTLAVTASSANGGSRSENYVLMIDPGTQTLTVDAVGLSEVTITGSHPGTTRYQAEVGGGESVTLTAPSPVGNYYFMGWSGCSSTGGTGDQTCTREMDGDRTVVASYELPEYIVDVNSTGASNVVIGSREGYGGQTNYPITASHGSRFSLDAPASHGSAEFVSWTGCTSTRGKSCSVDVDANRTVTANYEIPERTLSVNSAGTDSVSMISSSGHNGTTNYTVTIPQGTAVELEAPLTSGNAEFVSWSGDCSAVVDNYCSLQVDATSTVTANYEIPDYALHVRAASGSPVDNVAISSSGDECSGTTRYYCDRPKGSDTTVTAPANQGDYEFESWTGCSSTSGTSCTVNNIQQNTLVELSYTLPTHTISVTSVDSSAVPIDASVDACADSTNYSCSRDRGSSTTFDAPAGHGNYVFQGWSGCDSSSGNTCTVSDIQADVTITATYEIPDYTITVASSGADNVSIYDITASAGDTTTYTRQRARGTNSTFRAPSTHGQSYEFDSWQGCDSTATSGRDCTISDIKDDRTITAVYYIPQVGVTVGSTPTNVFISRTNGGGTTTYTSWQQKGLAYKHTAPRYVDELSGDNAYEFASWGAWDCSFTEDGGRSCWHASSGGTSINATYTCTGYICNNTGGCFHDGRTYSVHQCVPEGGSSDM